MLFKHPREYYCGIRRRKLILNSPLTEKLSNEFCLFFTYMTLVTFLGTEPQTAIFQDGRPKKLLSQ